MEEEHWIRKYWRPALAWQYVLVCLFDFVIAPVMNALLAYYTHGTYIPWVPLTLGEGGFYHMAMGATIGVSAWTRGQEKIQKIPQDNGFVSTTTTEKTEVSSK